MLLLNIFPKGNTILHFAYKYIGLYKRFYQVITENQVDGEQFEIPFINNFDGLTPLHKCLDNKNYKSADILLQTLANTPLDSHARAIVEILPELIEQNLQSMKSYLDARLLQTDQIRAMKKGALFYKNYIEGYVLDACQLWPDKFDIKRKLFKESPLDQEIKLEFIDLPLIHSFGNKISKRFFDSLATVNNMDLFTSRTI